MVKPITDGLILISAAVFFTTMLLSSPAVEGTSGAHELGFFFPAASGACNAGSSIEECTMNAEKDGIDGMEEGMPEMDSESNRRILYWRRRYISYGALQRDRVPCSRRGISYYNCRPGAPVNPYVRGCNAITRCRSF